MARQHECSISFGVHRRLAVLLMLVWGTGASAAQQYQAVVLSGGPGADQGAMALAVGGGTQAGYQWFAVGPERAATWSGSAATEADINPSWALYSMVLGVGDGQMVGWDGYGQHGVLWPGGGQGPVDLTPLGFPSSFASAVSGGQQVGFAGRHAVLWTGTAGSAVDLNPAGSLESAAYGVANGQQVGYAEVAGVDHAYVWSGTAVGGQDINPVGFRKSFALATSGVQQVGYGLPAAGSDVHALIWSGTGASAIDLNPLGFQSSVGTAIVGAVQVGYGYDPSFGTYISGQHVSGDPWYTFTPRGTGGARAYPTHALAWYGSENGFVDLNAFLPAGFFASEAWGVDTFGDIVGVGYTWIPDGDGGMFGLKHAVMWLPVPEPCGGLLALVGGFWCTLRRWRGRA
jgi:hypothetical protein